MSDVIEQRKNHLIDLVDESISNLRRQQQLQAPGKKFGPQSRDTILSRFYSLRQYLDVLPKLSRTQFESLPSYYRENYIGIVEKLAASCAENLVALKQLDNTTAKRSVSGADLDLASVEKSFDDLKLSSGTAHYTLEAIRIVKEREERRRAEKVEQCRRNVIQQYAEPTGVKMSVRRLLFKFKVGKLVGEASSTSSGRIERLRQWLAPAPQPSSTTNGRFLLRQPIPRRILQYHVLDSLEYLCRYTVLFDELKDHWLLSDYALEECMLFAILNDPYISLREKSSSTTQAKYPVVYDASSPNEGEGGSASEYKQQVESQSLYQIVSYNVVTRAIPDPEAEKQREIALRTREEIDAYNEKLATAWPGLSNLERLRRFIRPNDPASQQSFESIVEKGEKLGLSEEKIVHLFQESLRVQQPNSYPPSHREQRYLTSHQSPIFVEEFDGNLLNPPEQKMDPSLEFGVHTISFKVAEKLQIPETVLLYHFKYDELDNALRDKPNGEFIKHIMLVLGLDELSKLYEYWSELAFFERENLAPVPRTVTTDVALAAGNTYRYPLEFKKAYSVRNVAKMYEDVREA